ncbi:MAG: hypothetical protein ACPGSM_01225 [Thiolinea sp.]
MRRNRSIYKVVIAGFILAGLSACNDDEIAKNFDFYLTNTAGGETLLDHTWYQECVPHTYLPNTWVDSQRTLSTNELAITEIFYGQDDCKSGALMIDISVVELTNKDQLVPIKWTKMDGQTPVEAPAGLEMVTEANALTFIVTKATRTPLTSEQAALLNAVADFGFGITDWAAGSTKDIKPIYETFNNPGTATLVLRDDGGYGCVYDGIPNPFVEEEYPGNVGYIPHCGPLRNLD